jgi:hypothetical protein
VAEPAFRAKTNPEVETLATAASLVVQATARPDSSAPAALRTTAVNCWVSPTVRERVFGMMVTEATGSGGAFDPPLPPQDVMPRRTAAVNQTGKTRCIILLTQTFPRP